MKKRNNNQENKQSRQINIDKTERKKRKRKGN